jgi:ferrous iron transport protein A
MTEMGLNVGAELVVALRQGGGVVVMRGETRFALGGGMAHKIMVAPAKTDLCDSR